MPELRAGSADVLVGFAPPVPAAAVSRTIALERGETTVVAPRRAASVVLLRDGLPGEGLETYLLHRHARMPFAASVAVFPGGGLDPVDASAPDAHRAADLVLMPPTWSILLELARLTTLAEAFAAAEGREVVTVLPRLVRRDEGWAFAYEVVR